jgi:hypothetical protein
MQGKKEGSAIEKSSYTTCTFNSAVALGQFTEPTRWAYKVTVVRTAHHHGMTRQYDIPWGSRPRLTIKHDVSRLLLVYVVIEVSTTRQLQLCILA